MDWIILVSIVLLVFGLGCFTSYWYCENKEIVSHWFEPKEATVIPNPDCPSHKTCQLCGELGHEKDMIYSESGGGTFVIDGAIVNNFDDYFFLGYQPRIFFHSSCFWNRYERVTHEKTETVFYGVRTKATAKDKRR